MAMKTNRDPDFSPGEIVKARIVRRTASGRYLVELCGQRLHVDSDLIFTAAEVYLQVHTISPRLHLKVISDNLDCMADIVRIGSRYHIQLDSFNRWCLAELIRSGRYACGPGHTPADLALLRRLACILDQRHLVPLRRYVLLLAENRPATEALCALARTDSVAVSLPAPAWDPADPAAAIAGLLDCYRRFRLPGHVLPGFADQPGIQHISGTLNTVNRVLAPHHRLTLVLLPAQAGAAAVLVQESAGSAGAAAHVQARVPWAGSRVLVHVRRLDIDLSLTIYYHDRVLESGLRLLQPLLAQCAEDAGLHLLSCTSRFQVPRPILCR